MYLFAPPAKVPRTQRQTVLSSGPLYSYIRSTELSSGLPQESPTSLDEAVVYDASSGVTMDTTTFLSGAGMHLCWLVDESKKLLRIWNTATPGWETSAPRLAAIPYFATAKEGLPLFASEMSAEEESIAFCSELGAVSSLDHSIEVQLLDLDAPSGIVASCFSCKRTRIDKEKGTIILTAVGTTTGLLIVDVKQHGEHYAMEFDRRQALTQRPCPKHESRENYSLAGSAAASSPPAQQSWWSSLKSLVRRNGAENDHEQTLNGEDGNVSLLDEPVTRYGMFDDMEGSESSVIRMRFAFQQVLFRQDYPQEIVAVNGAAEVFLLQFDDWSTKGVMKVRWYTCLSEVLHRPGCILSVAESRHKIFLLFYSPSNAQTSLPSLLLVTLDTVYGTVVNCVTLNSIADFVATASSGGRLAKHHIRLYGDDTHREVIVCVGEYVLRVNNQVGVQSPCHSEDIVILKNLNQPMTSVFMEDGSLITLDLDGPHLIIDDLRAPEIHLFDTTAPRHRSLLGACSDTNGDDQIKEVLSLLRSDDKLTLDECILRKSEDLSSEELRDSAAGNWARCNLNNEDSNIVTLVTKQLRRRQQAHRRFVLAVVKNESVRSQLSEDTLAHLLSTQEALVSMATLRSLQNIGTIAPTSGDELLVTHQQLRSFMELQEKPLHEGDSSHRDTLLLLHDQSNGASLQLVKNTEQVNHCQQILRHAIVTVASDLRRSLGLANETFTAAELCYADPANTVLLLRAVGEYMTQLHQTVTVSLEEKFAQWFAAGTIYVMVAQSMIESRRDLGVDYEVPTSVCTQLWTSLEGHSGGVALCFSQLNVGLADALADTLNSLSSASSDTVANLTTGAVPSLSNTVTLNRFAVGKKSQLEMLELIAFLSYFILSNVSHDKTGDEDAVTSVSNTLLRKDYGASEVRRQGWKRAEQLALHFGIMPILMQLALPQPVNDPIASIAQYETLQRYARENVDVIDAALQYLLRHSREWELLCLPSVLPECRDTRERLNRFLEHHAPHLLWLVEPSRYDAFIVDRATTLSCLPYGPDAVTHRSRCNALGRLAWIANGAVASSWINDINLSEAIVDAQRTFLSVECSGKTLGAQETVQRLLAKEEPRAWVQAALVAMRTRSPLDEDLLVQILRRCKAYDGVVLEDIYRSCVSELEMHTSLSKTALGGVVTECQALHDVELLRRIGASVLSAEELSLITSWRVSVWTGNQPVLA